MLNDTLLNSCNNLLKKQLISPLQYEECQELLNQPNDTWYKNKVKEKSEYDKLLEEIKKDPDFDYKKKLEELTDKNKDNNQTFTEFDQKMKEVEKLENELNREKDKSFFIIQKKLIAENNLTIFKYQLGLYGILTTIVILIMIYYNI